MAKNLEGDRRRLDQDGPGRFGYRLLMALVIVLGGIALGIWRHVG
jgi:hypothetical protein